MNCHFFNQCQNKVSDEPYDFERTYHEHEFICPDCLLEIKESARREMEKQEKIRTAELERLAEMKIEAERKAKKKKSMQPEQLKLKL